MKSLFLCLTLLTTTAITYSPWLAYPVKSSQSVDTFLASVPTTNSGQADLFYQEARDQMEQSLGDIGEDYYTLYRIVERIARANGLDEHPWRIRATRENNVNAFASELNVLTFEGGLLEQIEGDTAALACVVGHEIAHHTHNHIPLRVKLESELKNLEESALLAAREEVEKAERQNQTINNVINILTSFPVLRGNRNSEAEVLAGAVANRVLHGLNENQANQAKARAEEIYSEKVKALGETFSEELHRQEAESDEVGYEYMVRAGFSPDGCTRTMTVLNRMDGSHLPSFSHPNPADRIEALAEMNTAAGNQALLSQGQANLSQSVQPLHYAVSRDNASLRVESKYGSQEDINGGFPQ